MKRRINLYRLFLSLRWLRIALFIFPTWAEAAGIEMTNGRVAMTSAKLFLSEIQEREADSKGIVSLTQGQSDYLGTASFLRHSAITNLRLLTIAEVRQVATAKLLNVAVRLTNDVIDVPFDFLGRDLAERDRWKSITLHSETSSSTRDDAVTELRKTTWFDLRYRITPLLCQYYAQHPERFKIAGPDEEIAIEGFAQFVANEQVVSLAVGGFQIHKGVIYDPWGEPLHFVQNRNRDGFINACGFKHIISRVAVGIQQQCMNEQEQLGCCKHSAVGFEDSPHNCIYVDVCYEADWAKRRRLNESSGRK